MMKRVVASFQKTVHCMICAILFGFLRVGLGEGTSCCGGDVRVTVLLRLYKVAGYKPCCEASFLKAVLFARFKLV